MRGSPTASYARRVDPRAVPRRVVVIAVVAIAVLTAGQIAGRGATGALLVVDVVVGVLACATVPVLLRSPVPPALVAAGLAALSPAATPGSTVGLLRVANERPLRTALLVGLTGFAAHAVQGWVRPVEDLPHGWFLVLDAVVHAAHVAWGALARSRRELLRSLRERARRAEEEQEQRVAAARAYERTVIAREMHDVLAHRLSLVAAAAGALEYRPDAAPQQLARTAGVVREGVHQALEELRAVIDVLRAPDESAEAPPQPTLTDVVRLVREARDGGTDVEFSDQVADAARAPAAIGRAAFRIVQETLTNARKHAPGEPVRIALTGGPDVGVGVEVTNPVAREVAPRVVPGSGTGLVGLAERAESVGGSLVHEAWGGEFRVTARLPWPT